MSAKTLLLELDSVHSTTLLKYAQIGAMPFLQKLMEGAATGEICYEIPLQVAAWFSLHSGQSVKAHQRVAYDELKTGTYSAQRAGYGLSPGMMYWESLDAEGLRVLVLNNIGGNPRPLKNGVHLCEFSTHSAGNYRKPVSCPSELAQTLQSRFPKDLFHQNDWGNIKFINCERLLNSTAANLERKCDVFCELIETEQWDHVHVCLDDLHSFGHMLWHLESEDITDPEISPKSDLFYMACQNLDAAIERLVKSSGVNTNLLIVTLAGIGQKNGWSHSLDKIIKNFSHHPHRRRTDLYGILGRLWVMTPHNITSRLLPLKTTLREKYLAPVRGRSSAFAFPKNEESGGIRINLQGREPEGFIAAGQEYDVLCRDLTDALLELRDVDSGIPLVDSIVNIPDLLGLDPLNNAKLPDLVVVWSRERRITAVHSERLGQITQDFEPARSGDHVIDGMFIAQGPVWDQKQARHKVMPMDIAPTLADIHRKAHDEKWTGSSLFEEKSTGSVNGNG